MKSNGLHTGSPTLATNFEGEVQSVLGSLRSALMAVLEHVQPPIRRASSIQHVLGLDANLSWSIFNAATADDPRKLATLLPGQRAMTRFLDAAQDNNVPAPVIDSAKSRFVEFEDLVRRHAGRRDVFQTMVAQVAPGAETQEEPAESRADGDLKNKRNAFRSLALLWGRQARLLSTAIIIHPSASPEDLDGVTISGVLGLRQTRRGVPLYTSMRLASVTDWDDPASRAPFITLDPRETGPNPVGFLRDFCSTPLPTFRSVLHENRRVSHHLESRGLGAAGEMDIYFGHRVRRIAERGPDGIMSTKLDSTKAIDVPTEVSIQDVLLHQSIWDERLPEMKTFAIPVDGSFEHRDQDVLPVAESAKYLGMGIDAARTSEIPRYTDVLAYAMDRAGWKPEEFRVFRCRIEYPIVLSRVRMKFSRWEAGEAK